MREKVRHSETKFTVIDKVRQSDSHTESQTVVEKVRKSDCQRNSDSQIKVYI